MNQREFFSWIGKGAIGLILLTGCNMTPTRVYFETPLPPAPVTVVAESLPAPTPPNTLPELIQALSSPNAEVRIGAAGKLVSMGSQAERAIPALTQNLCYQGVYEVRMNAARALDEIGPAAHPAVPVLIVVLLTDYSVHPRRAAASALGKIGKISSVPALARGLYDEDVHVRIEAAEAIAQLVQQEFPGSNLTTPERSGHELDDSGEAMVVVTVRTWWEDSGWQQDWLAVSKANLP